MALRFADHQLAALAELRWHDEPKRIRAYLAGDRRSSTTPREAARLGAPTDRPVVRHTVDDIDGSLVAGRPAARTSTPCIVGDGPPVLDPSTGFAFHTTPGHSQTSSPTGDPPGRRLRCG